jgi:hypothetical protein
MSIADRASRVSAQHWVHDVQENAPEHPTLVGRATDGGPLALNATSAVTFGSGAANYEEGKFQALIRLDTTGYSSTLSGDYLITAVTHQARQYAGLGQGGEADCPYTNTAILIPREDPWRPEIKPMGDLPLIFSARIESRDPIPELDAAGRYRYRQYPDSNQAPHAEASPPIRRLQPYSCPSEAMPIGWHLPLHDDNEVLISCLNNDPDQPMLVGTLSNPAHGSVVTQENAHQNLLYTAGDNQLAMDDWRDKSTITLCTFAGHNMLHFNADVHGHRVNLASGLGQMEEGLRVKSLLDSYGWSQYVHNMTRPLRIEYPGAWYHVMNRGRRGEKVFADSEDFMVFIALLQETSEMFAIRISAFCLMSNHYHILVQTPAGNLSRAMRHINGVYTQRYNRRRNI